MIDSHVHVGNWRYFDTLNRVYVDFLEIVQQLEKRGFRGAGLIPSDLKSNQELLREIQEYKAKGGKFRCWFFPWLNPLRANDLAFAKDHVNDMAGMKFHPSLDQARFTMESHKEFLDLAAQANLPILVHCGAWEEMASYRWALDVAEKCPEVNLILAHQGGTTYEQKVDACSQIVERKLSNVYLDLAGTHEYWILEKCVQDLGAERFLLGSDFPIRDAAIYPVVVDGCRLSEREKQIIKSDNFLRLVGPREIRGQSR